MKLFKHKIDYAFLRVFGCACCPLLRPYNKNKLQFRSQECIFLGYSPMHKGYKCLSSDDRIYISKYVVFNEAKFPYCDMFPPTPIPNHKHCPPCPQPLSPLPLYLFLLPLHLQILFCLSPHLTHPP